MSTIPGTPLLAADSIIDAEAKKVIDALYREETSREWNPPATDHPLCPKRMNRVNFTIQEIDGQAEKIRETLTEEKRAVAEAAAHFAKREIDHIYLTGCGDSIAAMDGARFLLEDILNVPCEPIQALDFAYYYNKCVTPKSLVVMLSSSGATLRTLEAMEVAKARGAQTLTLSNTPGSILMEKSARGLVVHAARKGWPTQASTAAMALVMQLGIYLARERGSCAPAELAALQTAFDRVPDQVACNTELSRAKIASLAAEWADKSFYLFVGGGPSSSCAFFGSAKVKEATPDYAAHIPMEEFHHYNSIKKNEPMFVVAPSGFSVPRARDTLIEGRHFGGVSCLVTSEGENELAALADHAVMLPPALEYFSGILCSPPLQLFGYYVAMEKFRRAKTETA